LLAGSTTLLRYSTPALKLTIPQPHAQVISGEAVAEQQLKAMRKDGKRVCRDIDISDIRRNDIPLEYASAATETILQNDPASVTFEKSRVEGAPDYPSISQKVEKLYAKGVTLSQLRTLLSARTHANEQAYTLQEIIESSTPVAYAAGCMRAIERAQGMQLGAIRTDRIDALYRGKNTIADLEALLNLTDNEDYLLIRPQDLAITDNLPLRYIKGFMQLKDNQGKMLYQRMTPYPDTDEDEDRNTCAHRAILAARVAYHAGVGLRQLKEWVKRFDVGVDDNNIFTRIATLSSEDGTRIVRCADELTGRRDIIGNLITGNTAYKLCAVGVTPAEAVWFNDTIRPNMLMDLPFSDYNGAFENKGVAAYIRRLKEVYDIGIIVARSKEDLERAAASLPEISLFAPAGHGSTKSLTLLRHPKHALSTSDDLSWLLQKLRPDAVIFLDACDNAMGSDNLAQHVERQASGRRVIASKVPFTSTNVHVKSLYPFDITIVVKEKGISRDVTYKSVSDGSKSYMPHLLFGTTTQYPLPLFPNNR
jgi:hypothetical protein